MLHALKLDWQMPVVARGRRCVVVHVGRENENRSNTKEGAGATRNGLDQMPTLGHQMRQELQVRIEKLMQRHQGWAESASDVEMRGLRELKLCSLGWQGMRLVSAS